MRNNVIIKLFFTPAEAGETAEITSGVELNVIGYYKSADGKISLPCFDMMSDYQWQYNCLIDRLFHPQKYQNSENVPGRIEHLIEWLTEHCKPELKEKVKSELDELVTFTKGIEDEYILSFYAEKIVKT